jgi:hypothetical protein
VEPVQRRHDSPVRRPGRRGGGFAVTESDDPASVARDLAKWTPYFEYTVYPVLDVAEAVAIMGEAAEWRQSIT